MQLYSGWPVLPRFDGFVQVGLCSDSKLLFPDPEQKLSVLLSRLEAGCTRKALELEARTLGLPLSHLDDLLTTLRQKGALAPSQAQATDAQAACESLRKKLLSANRASFDSAKANFSTREIYVCAPEKLLDMICLFLRRTGFTQIYRWEKQNLSGPEKIVLDIDGPSIDPSRYEDLVAGGVMHLPVTLVSPWRVEIGPLVKPSYSACLRCTAAHKAHRDPGFSAVIAQSICLPCPTLSNQLELVLAAEISRLVLGWGLEIPDLSAFITLTTWGTTRGKYPPHPSCTCLG